jgi:rhodanese-related sulfurtransferase
MPEAATPREMSFEDAVAVVDDAGAFVDLRPVDAYLEVHIPGSLALLYEFGPGMAARARDCLPLDVPLVLLDLGHGDLAHAAASLRGKGFTVLGRVADGINRWAEVRSAPASTEVVEGDSPPPGAVLDVGDPGAAPPESATAIPIEHLWIRADELSGERRVTVSSGYGVRAALAVGILERAGVEEVFVWRRRAGSG